jgi:hypothetical protein
MAQRLREVRVVAEVIALICAGRTYVNVHSSKFTPGEIRSQIKNRDGDHHEHDNH